MDIIKQLEYLQDIIETSRKAPIIGKAIINQKEVLEIIDNVINYLPDEFKKAQWISEEKERILSEALREAEIIKKENIDILRKQIENHDVTKEAKLRAEEIIASAQRDAKAMRLGARDYADEILCQLEKQIDEKGQQMVLRVNSEVQNFISSLENDVSTGISTIRDNIKELRNIK